MKPIVLRVARYARRGLGLVMMHSASYLAHKDSRLALPIAAVLGHCGRGHLTNLRRIPLQWLDADETCLRVTLEPAENSISCGPTINGSHREEPITLPGVNLYQYDDGIVCAESSSILVDGRIIVERVPGVDIDRCDYSGDHIVMHGKRTACVSMRSTERIGSGLFLAGNGSFNYYHWMIEILPKLRYLCDQGSIPAGVPILINETVANTSSMSDALHQIAGDWNTVVMTAGKSYRVEKLFYVNAPSACPMNLRQGQQSRVADFLIRGSSVEFLRTRLMGGSDAHLGHAGERVFFLRPSRRRIYNQDEVLALFEPHGFVGVQMDQLSLTEQIALVSRAEFLAGPTGAAWTNLVFCSQGARGLCWMADQAQGFAAYSNLAKIAGVELRYVTYWSDARSTGEAYTLPYAVDANRVQAELELLLRSPQ